MAARLITLESYNPAWPDRFSKEANWLRASLGKVVVAVHHIGSTSVPGLTAKPVIDILLEVADIAALDACADTMQGLGYTPRGEYGIPGRRYFVKGDAARTHHIHAFRTGSAHITRHLAFRDYLRAHEGIAREYEALKLAAARDSGYQSVLYSALKNEFIATHERLALAQ